MPDPCIAKLVGTPRRGNLLPHAWGRPPCWDAGLHWPLENQAEPGRGLVGEPGPLPALPGPVLSLVI